MRQGIVAVALGAALAVTGGAAPAAPLPAPAKSAIVDEAAVVSWTFPTRVRDPALWIFSGAWRQEAAGGTTRTFAFVVTGTCRLHAKHHYATSCRGRGTGGRIAARRFHLDPALRSARLVFGGGGRAGHEVSWRATRKTLPYGYFAAETCAAGDGEGAGVHRPALARGRSHGRTATHDAVDFAVLARGAIVTDCRSPIRLRTLRRAAAGKTAHVVFRGPGR
jgi:hypothetical protein